MTQPDPTVPNVPTASAPLFFRSLDQSATGMELSPPTPPVSRDSGFDPELIARLAREEGRREASALLESEIEFRIHSERQSVAAALERFTVEKKRYFSGLEKEVVRLALAIAERVLHRESSMDPTLLAGAARVALDQVDQDSAAVLLVCPEDVAQWQTILPTLGREIELRVDATVPRGDCLLQTERGSFELGLRTQLCEIERGFFELISRSHGLPA